MLFNSAVFIFIFLPITLSLYSFTAKKWGGRVSTSTLALCSLGFYAWWNPNYLPILIGSIVFNFYVGKYLANNKHKLFLIVGITANIALLAYYKYTNFAVDNINLILSEPLTISYIILPLAISFFTFQQIAYLVDSYQGITKDYDFLHYTLFVSFFPQLIAGPIVHHKEMHSQFEKQGRFKLHSENIAIGLTIFAIGLFKKTVLADGISAYATPIFSMADSGQSLDFFQAWGGVLAYTFQLYFDFSGYSDMAIGLARIFGIILPLNFYSPYKSTSITEFWRRWHMTLSRFLRDYIYFPLGGNKKGKQRRYLNLIITMLIGGIWHGAGWNFLIWGAMHGTFLIINHSWATFKEQHLPNIKHIRMYLFSTWLITFLAVCFSWTFFRAVTFDGAINLIYSMLGGHGFHIPNAIYVRLGSFSELLDLVGITPAQISGSTFMATWCWNFTLLSFVLLLPNVQDLFSSVKGSLNKLHYEQLHTFWPLNKFANKVQWQSNSRWSVIGGAAFALGILTLTQVSEFLYFQF